AEVELELLRDDEKAPAAPRRRPPAPALVAALVAAAAAYFYLRPADRRFWRFVYETSPRVAVTAILGDLKSPPPPDPSTATSPANVCSCGSRPGASSTHPTPIAPSTSYGRSLARTSAPAASTASTRSTRCTCWAPRS